MRLVRLSAGLAAALLATACGSTVQPGQLTAADAAAGSDGGLGGPPAATAPPGASPGVDGGVTGPGGVVAGPGVVPGSPGTSAGVPGSSIPPPAPGSARVTSPISVGLLYAVNDGAAPAGIDNGTTITPGRVVRAYVESWNDSGGIGGRRIEPVYAEMHSYDRSYEQQIAAACATFTEDNHVAAVLVSVQYYSEQLLNCLAQANVLLVTGDFVAPDRQAAERYPLVVTPLTQLGEDREASTVRHLTSDGFLGSRNRVGVIVEDCPVGERIYENGLVPALRAAGNEVASAFHTQCFQSIQDFGAQTSEMSSAVLQFRRAQVDRVMVVSAAAEANIVFAFSEVAESQGYRPGYGLTSVAIPIALQLNAPAQQMENMRGVGWLPVLDTSLRSQIPTTPTGRLCLRRLKDQGVTPQSATDVWTAWNACESFVLYDALLRASSGSSDAATLLGLVPAVASSYVSASTVNGRVGTRGGRVVPLKGRIFAFDEERQFHYVGASFRL